MIRALTGIVSFRNSQSVELLVGRVSFLVLVPAPLLNSLTLKKKVTLYIKMVVGEKILELYGFENREDREIFEMLTSVSGVGPRTALQIFNQKKGAEIKKAIDQADVAFFSAIKGIGQKTAQRLIVDLRSVLDRERLEKEKAERKKAGFVYEALLQLGFNHQEIRSVIPHLLEKGSDEEKISQALGWLSKKNER